MRRGLAVLVAAILFVACGGGGDGNAVVRLVTPAGSDSFANPGATPTAIPAPEVILSSTSVYQAGAVLVSVTGDVTGGRITFRERVYPLTQGSQSMYSFIPVDTGDPAGPQALRIDFTLTNGTNGTIAEEIIVLVTEWSVDSLTFSEEQRESLADPRTVANELELLKVVYSVRTPEKLWDGEWLIPVDSTVTGRFGEQRAINGAPPAGHHGGTDIGAEMGTPVFATNNGRVSLSRQLTVRGNTVVVDHGGGLFSGYAHMSSLAVTEGQLVAKGDVVGYVGNSGLSTGAHLHWEMAQLGVLLDALRFLDGSNGF